MIWSYEHDRGTEMEEVSDGKISGWSRWIVGLVEIALRNGKHLRGGELFSERICSRSTILRVPHFHSSTWCSCQHPLSQAAPDVAAGNAPSWNTHAAVSVQPPKHNTTSCMPVSDGSACATQSLSDELKVLSETLHWSGDNYIEIHYFFFLYICRQREMTWWCLYLNSISSL